MRARSENSSNRILSAHRWDARIASQRIANVALGLSLAWWTVRTLVSAPLSAVTGSVAALNLVVAFLFAFRLPERRSAALVDVAASLPALLVGALVLALAPASDRWAQPLTVVFVGATAWTCASLLTLGRSFAILPGVRQVVVRGPYRLVRHPAYAGELVMLAACVAGSPSGGSATALVAATAFVGLRIHSEERSLLRDQDYRDYAAAQRWRLIPGLW